MCEMGVLLSVPVFATFRAYFMIFFFGPKKIIKYVKILLLILDITVKGRAFRTRTPDSGVWCVTGV